MYLPKTLVILEVLLKNITEKRIEIGSSTTNYLNNLDFLWVLKAPDGFFLEIRFQEFKLESQSKCHFDNLTLFDGTIENGKILAILCGNDGQEKTYRARNTLTIAVKTDASVTMRGFKAKVVKGRSIATFPSDSYNGASL